MSAYNLHHQEIVMQFKTLNLQQMDRADAYKIFITAIVPRPIGWISTLSKSGIANAAPFSWFNAVCADPPMVMIAAGKRRGEMKDTTANIRDTGEFVVNIATEANATQMVQSSGDYPMEISEFDKAGLSALPSKTVRPPRIAQSPIHFECRLEKIIPLGRQSTDLILGQCILMHVDESVLAADGLVDALKLRPIARLGRDEYSVVDQLVHHPRPLI
jgi:flavin reductase (DIM6/NTAB) family NADH-FMN oxidoreductase RutF